MSKKIGGKKSVLLRSYAAQRALNTGEDSRPIFPLSPHYSSNAQVTQTNLYTSFQVFKFLLLIITYMFAQYILCGLWVIVIRLWQNRTVRKKWCRRCIQSCLRSPLPLENCGVHRLSCLFDNEICVQKRCM